MVLTMVYNHQAVGQPVLISRPNWDPRPLGIENYVPNSSSIVVAGRCLAMVQLFFEQFRRNGQYLISHVRYVTSWTMIMIC
jgi:hypothetical protein